MWFWSRHTFARADLETVALIPLCGDDRDSDDDESDDESGNDDGCDRVDEHVCDHRGNDDGADNDNVSDQPIIWVREMDESESGQMVLKKVKWTYFDAYLWQTMWNHAKKSMEGSKLSDLVFLQWEVTDWQELFAKNAENKGN